MSKVCGECEKEKEDVDFYKHNKNKGGLSFWCKACVKQKEKERYLANPEKAKAKNKRWKTENPDKEKDGKLRREYGITLKQHNEILADQRGCCAICEKPKALGVDHDHVTLDIRGLLCRDCNTILGMAHDDIGILQNTIRYLLRGPLIKITKNALTES